jgi:hypothetical protein
MGSGRAGLPRGTLQPTAVPLPPGLIAWRQVVVAFLQAGSYDTDGLVGVLGELRRFLGGQKATLLWDGLPAHRSKAMQAFIASQRDWLVVERLPAYAPELNPVEGLWSNLKGKGGELANLAVPTLGEVIEQAHRGVARVRGAPHLAYSFLRRTGLSVSSAS